MPFTPDEQQPLQDNDARPARRSVVVANHPSAWCWIQKQSAIRAGNKTWFAVVGGPQGDRQTIVEWNHDTQRRSERDVSLPSTRQKDDHNQPTLWRRSDGRLVCAFSPHNGQGYTRLSTNPDDCGSWGSATAIDSGGTSRQSYPSLLFDGTQLFCLVRQDIRRIDQWKLIPLNDDGTMDGEDREAVWYAQSTSHKPYVIPMADQANGRLHFFSTRWSQNVAEDNREIWHAYRQAGRWHDSQGMEISHLDSQGGGFYHSPAWQQSGYDRWTRVYTATEPESCWVMDAACDAAGNPMVLWQRETTGDWGNGEFFEFWLSRWKGGQWRHSKVCDSGHSPAGNQHGYSGVAIFDLDDPTRIFAAVEVDNVHEIQRFDTTNSGATWSKQADLTTGSNSPNWRPVAVHGRVVGEPPEVAWMGDGAYLDFTQYETRIIG